MFRVRTITMLLCGSALLAGGCGSSERVEYERELAKVGRIVDTALAELPQDETTTLGPEQVSSLAEDLREAADQLEDLEPPSGAKAPQERLEQGLRGIAKAFDALADDLQEADTDQQKAEVFVKFSTDQRVDAAFDDVLGAQEAYADKGYRVFGTRAPKDE